jgi:hypothetical protein
MLNPLTEGVFFRSGINSGLISRNRSFSFLIKGILKPYLVFSRCHEKHLFAHTREGDNPPTNISTLGSFSCDLYFIKDRVV